MAAVVKAIMGIKGPPVCRSNKRMVPSKLQSITHFKQKLKLTIGEPILK